MSLKDKIKTDIKLGWAKLKMIIHDEYIHSFGLGMLIFSFLFMVSLHRAVNNYPEPKWLTKIFLAGLIASGVMFLVREVYLYSFKKVEVSGVIPAPSLWDIFYDIYKSYGPNSLKEIFSKIIGFWQNIKKKILIRKISAFLGKVDYNVLGWIVVFFLCFL